MSDSVTSILSQIRSYQTQMGQGPMGQVADAARGNQIQGLAGAQGTPATQAPSFSETLRGAIGGVNEAQQKSGALAKAFEMGDPSADLARVMVASSSPRWPSAPPWKSATVSSRLIRTS